jgi:hypothetical protein
MLCSKMDDVPMLISKCRLNFGQENTIYILHSTLLFELSIGIYNARGNRMWRLSIPEIAQGSLLIVDGWLVK